MTDLCRLIFWTLVDLMRARATLEAEIWVLRQQINVLRRAAPRRRSFGIFDIVITNAIKTAFIDHPSSGHGTTWDQITKSDEESIHLAKAVLIALRKAGYSISKVEDENAPRP
jgi:hypothetical protein